MICGRIVVRSWCGPCAGGVEKLAGNCSAICSGSVRNSMESVRKMNENQNENCADLRKRSDVILHSPESGIAGPNETTRQANSDDQLIALWLHGRPDHTQRAYRAEVDRFMGMLPSRSGR